jgi:hypothetical protein
LNSLLNLSEAELLQAMREMKALRDTGVLSIGVVRMVAAHLVREAGLSEGDALKVAKVELVEAAAFKWAGLSAARDSTAAAAVTPAVPANSPKAST